MKPELEELGHAVRAHRANGGGLRIPPALRDQIIATARQARANGWSISAIAKLIGVSNQSVMRWLKPRETSASARLVPVRVAAQQPPPPAGSATLILISPSGWKISGLDIFEAAALLRAVQ